MLNSSKTVYALTVLIKNKKKKLKYCIGFYCNKIIIIMIIN